MGAALRGPWDADPDAPPARAPVAGPWDNDEEVPGGLESWIRGAHQGATFGYMDEAKGLAGALGDVVTGGGWTYSKRRDEARAADKAAEEANPGLFRGGQMAGGVGSMLIPGLGPGKGLAGAAKTGAALGAAQGLGESEADLTEGEIGQAAADAGLGAVVGAAAGGVGHGVAKGVGAVASKVANRGARGVAEATAEERTRQALAQAQKEASALGKYRSAVQSASRDLEVLSREAAELPEGTVKRAAGEFIESPEGVAVREMVAGNKLGTAPERLSEMAQLRGEHAALVTGREGLIDQATSDAMRDPLRRQFAPRLATLGHRLVPAALAGVGGAIGGPEGAAVGAGLGGVMALTQGRPGIIIRNLVRSPAARAAVWGMVQRAATIAPQSLGKFGSAIAAALRNGAGPLAEALHGRALENDPEYQAGVLNLLNGGTVDSGGAR